MRRNGEIIAMSAIALLIAVGGRRLLAVLAEYRLWGALLGVALVVLAVRELRSAYDPERVDARIEVTKAGAYFIAAVLAVWAVVAPARWNVGSCIVAVEVGVVLDIIVLAAHRRVAGGN